MYTLVENNYFWMSTLAAIGDFVRAFESSVRVQKRVVWGPVHCLELCRVGRGWYARVFGWAVQCGVAFGLRMDWEILRAGGSDGIGLLTEGDRELTRWLDV